MNSTMQAGKHTGVCRQQVRWQLEGRNAGALLHGKAVTESVALKTVDEGPKTSRDARYAVAMDGMAVWVDGGVCSGAHDEGSQLLRDGQCMARNKHAHCWQRKERWQ